MVSGFLTSDKVRDSPLKCIMFANIEGEIFTGDQMSLVLCFVTETSKTIPTLTQKKEKPAY